MWESLLEYIIKITPPPFVYSPLRLGDGEIRLMLLEFCEDAKIQCEIKHTKLSDKPRYEALSYVWGPPERTKSILVNNQVLSVRENLYWALFYLETHNSTRTMDTIGEMALNPCHIPAPASQSVNFRLKRKVLARKTINLSLY
jgi:hypothetical protein